jgi:5-methyltetrahydropteroyltriglutamate--homocysteine methyltransferase
MNLISVIGYPRLGVKRELKFILESYFDGSISEMDMIKAVDKIKIDQWLIQQKAGVSFIPLNDFSYYDNFLDTAIMLGVIPEDYLRKEFSEFDSYFALARGYQKNDIDLKAFEMKKWFNNNYHYVVPELNEGLSFNFSDVRIINDLELAKSAGIKTKPVIIGPFTFLKLSKITQNGKTIRDFIDPVLNNYINYLNVLQKYKFEILQFDEPVIVTDLNEDDIKIFKDIYRKILASKGSHKLLLQTYFGDIRDIYKEVLDLNFDAVGLDFIEGTENIGLIKKTGFPDDKLLFAGIVNGKNIWRNNYNKSMNILLGLEKTIDKKNIVLSTSCSLVHVPYTLKSELKMKNEIKEQLSFAEEKLDELNDLAVLFDNKDFNEEEIYITNQKIINSKKYIEGFNFPEIDENIKNISENDFNRKSLYSDRIKIQKKELNLPIYPTTTIGSFPQDRELRQTRNALKKGRISEAEYNKYIQDRIKKIVEFQEEIGIDVLVHGEYERNDMVEYFGENLSGFVFTENGWVLSYGIRGVKPPVIFGDIKRNHVITAEWSKIAQSFTEKPMKGMLTGPVTIYNWSFPRDDKPAKDVVYQIGLALREETADIEKCGIKIIQIDEAALREKLPLRKKEWNDKYLDWAIKAFRLASSSVNDGTQIHTHMCYSDFTDIIDSIKKLDADVITIEAAKSDLSILKSLKENNYDHQIGPGVYDIHSPRIPPVNEIVHHLEKIAGFIKSENIWVNPDCGLKTRGMNETSSSLKNMVEAAKIMRKKYSV